jgi:hypothetical protein
MKQQYIKQLSTPALIDGLLSYIQNSRYADDWARLSADRTVVWSRRFENIWFASVMWSSRWKFFFQPLAYEAEAWEVLQQAHVMQVLKSVHNTLPEFLSPRRSSNLSRP